MSNTGEMNPIEKKEKGNTLSENNENDKPNLKITIIPKVIVKSNISNKEITKEPENKDKKDNIEITLIKNEEKINEITKTNIKNGNVENIPKENKMLKIEEQRIKVIVKEAEKEENAKEVIQNKEKKEEVNTKEVCQQVNITKIEVNLKQEIPAKEKDDKMEIEKTIENIPQNQNEIKDVMMNIEENTKKDEKKNDNYENCEDKVQNNNISINNNNKVEESTWGEDKIQNNNSSIKNNNIGEWGNGQNEDSAWGESDKNQNNNNAWGESDKNNNNNSAWGDSDKNQNNNSAWGGADNEQKTNSGWADGNNSNNNIAQNIQQMEIEDDKDIREDVGPLPEAKAAADTFALCEEKKENKMTWFNRDGRNNAQDPYIKNEMERLLKEHENFCSRKEDKTGNMESIDFKAYYVKIYSNDPPIELKEGKRPKIRFENMNKLPEILANNLKMLKFDYLTPIQRIVMPYIQVGKDIVCVAETGSGKTIAYLFPIIGLMLISGVPENPFLEKTETNTENNSEKTETKKHKTAFPLSLILVPTRELAIQVSNESKKLSFNTGIRTVALYGGEGKRNQIIELGKGCDICVATPGRLIDLFDKKLIDLRMVKNLILDEADRMLDQSFYPDLRKIIDNIPKRKFRQNLLFSATFDDEIKGLAKFCLNNYYFFKPLLESPKQIKHDFIQVLMKKKLIH